MRDEDRGDGARGAQDALEDLRLAAHVELSGRLVEEHEAGARMRGGESARERDAPPLPAREIGTARIRAREHAVEIGEARGAGVDERRARTASSVAPAGATLSRSGSSKRMKSWKTAVVRARQAATSSSRRSTPSTRMAPACGS